MKWLWPRQRQVEPQRPDWAPEPESEQQPEQLPEPEESPEDAGEEPQVAFVTIPAELAFQYMAPPWTPPTLMQIGGQPYLIVRAWPMRES